MRLVRWIVRQSGDPSFQRLAGRPIFTNYAKRTAFRLDLYPLTVQLRIKVDERMRPLSKRIEA